MKNFGLTIENMVRIKREELENLLQPSIFKEPFAEHIKYIANHLEKNLNGVIPNTKKELMEELKFDSSFANLALYFCFNLNEGN